MASTLLRFESTSVISFQNRRELCWISDAACHSFLLWPSPNAWINPW